MPRHPPAAGNGDLALAINLKGSTVVSVRGRELALGEQDAVLGARIEIESVIEPDPHRFLVLAIPRAASSSLVANADDAIGRPIPRDSPPLQLLMKYVGLIQEQRFPVTPELQIAIVAHIRDLVSLIIGEAPDAAARASSGGVRAARLRAIRIDILANMNSADVSLAAVAARQGISASYVRKLFESEGTSFTEFVLDQRLSGAYRMLTSPRLTHRSISDIALDVGFRDLSYFNRAFRRRFGQTPSQIRLAALRKE
jgi:AraC-like DNA-binding protein